MRFAGLLDYKSFLEDEVYPADSQPAGLA